MPTNLKHIFSILIIGSFLLMALASLGPDGSTNTTVTNYSSCEVKPPTSGTIHISVFYKDNSGNPIPNAAGTLFITHQAIGNSTECKYTDIQYFTHHFTTDSGGGFGADGWDFTHTNSQDVYRVEVLMKRSATHTGYQEVQVGYYNVRNFDFSCTGLKKIDL